MDKLLHRDKDNKESGSESKSHESKSHESIGQKVKEEMKKFEAYNRKEEEREATDQIWGNERGPEL